MVRSIDDARRLTPERVPPHNLDAEESVLGAMMLSREAIADVVEQLKPDDFYKSAHARIYRSLLAIYARGDPVDAITAVHELRAEGILDDVGGYLHVHELVERVPTPASAGYYARIVAQLALLRRLIQAAGDIMQAAYSVPEDPERAADEAEARIYAVARREEKDAVVSVRDLIDQAMLDLEHAQQRDGAFAGVPTGFTDLDNLLSGLQKGNLVVVAARPGVGKSSFVTNLARNVAVDANAPVALFSLEMSRWEIGMRLLCGEARVPWDRVRAGRVGAEDWSRIVEAAEALHRAPLYIVDAGHVTIVDIRAKARRMSASEQGLGLIIVDYLQLMSHHGRSENRQQEVAEISRSLKLLAKELNIPVIAVSQLNRDPERRQDKRPQLADLRECVTGDTLVGLRDGRRVPIARLVGTEPEVLAMTAQGRIVDARSDRVWLVGRRPVFAVRLASGRAIRATARHRLFGSRGWVRVGDLEVGDRVRAISQRAMAGLPGTSHGGTSHGGTSHYRFSPSRSVVLEYSELLHDEVLRADATNDLFWDRVVEVTPDGEDDVFDLTVPGPSSWLAGGIVCHNSGAIEQDSDVVMFIHRDDSGDLSAKGTADLIVAKHRNGPTDTVKLTFLPQLTQFRNYAAGV